MNCAADGIRHASDFMGDVHPNSAALTVAAPTDAPIVGLEVMVTSANGAGVSSRAGFAPTTDGSGNAGPDGATGISGPPEEALYDHRRTRLSGSVAARLDSVDRDERWSVAGTMLWAPHQRRGCGVERGAPVTVRRGGEAIGIQSKRSLEGGACCDTEDRIGRDIELQ